VPVVVYYGDESFLLEQAVLRLREEIVNPAMASLCHRVYTQPSLATVLECVGSVSLALGGQTLVEIRDFPMLCNASKDAGTDAQLEELKQLLENVEPTKTVLFYSAKIDGKIKFPKWITKHPQFQVQKFESYKFWEVEKVADFLIHYAQKTGTKIQPDAADLLVNLLGTDLRLLINEVGKLSLYAHNRPIVRDDVLKMCNHSDNVFQIINRWILQESPTENFQDLNEIMLRRHPVEVFALLQTVFNNIFRVMWLNAQGLSPDAIAQRTGQKPFTVKKHVNQFRRVPMARWLKLKNQLVNLEWKSKTGQLNGQLALEVLLGA
jgi:DNA polymerase III subunit delta